MNILRVTLILSLLATTAFSQNLVPNPGFEDYSLCPDGDDQLHLVEHWNKISNAEGTPDYYNRCFIPNPPWASLDVPNNWNGYQESHSGDAYVGVYTYGYDDLREYIQVELIEPLESDQIYDIQMYVNTANYSGIAIDAFGIYISEELVSGQGDYLPLDVVPQVSNPSNNIMLDTAEWTLISGQFTALGNERYLTIGNFLPDSLTQSFLFDPNGFEQGYTYIDDVSVTLADPTNLNQEQLQVQSFSVYPNPTNGKINFESEVVNTHFNFQVLIYDKIGRQLIEENNIATGIKHTIDLSTLPGGIYMYKILTDKDQVIAGRIIKL